MHTFNSKKEIPSYFDNTFISRIYYGQEYGMDVLMILTVISFTAVLKDIYEIGRN